MDNFGLLEDAKRRFLKAQADIRQLRDLIAADTCPLKLGDIIRVDDNGRHYEAVVEMIHGAPDKREIINPILGAGTFWVVNGHRLRKADRQLSRWSFGFREDDAIFRDGVWVVAERNLDAFFGFVDRFPGQVD